MNEVIPEYLVWPSARAKYLRLKVTRDNGLVVVIPKSYDKTKIPALIRQKKVWIAEAQRRIGETRRFLEPEPSKHLPESLKLAALGETWTIAYHEDQAASGTRISAQRYQLHFLASDLRRDAVILKLKEWLRSKVRRDLFPIAKKLASQHGLNANGLLVKSQRTRWASCSAKKNLSLNTKLLFLTPDLVRYVILHELCHTVHMSHSQKFWRLVAACEPNYKLLDQRLREAWKHVPQWLFSVCKPQNDRN